MGERWMAQGEIPAGTDADKNFLIGTIPEGKKLTLTTVSNYGGDGSERYNLNLIPAGNPTHDVTTDGDSGLVNLLYPISGGVFTVTAPNNALTGINLVTYGPIPGPGSITAAAAGNATAAALKITLLGILEDL